MRPLSLRLGIDLDGVVADFTRGWIERYNAEFGAEIPLDAVRSWNGMQELTHFRDMDEFWEWARDHGGASLFRWLETYTGAVEALEKLDRAGHEVVILTTKPDWAIHDTFAWIAEKRLPTREVHITFRKWRVPCDVYLDDAPHMIERIHKERPEAITCRYVRPWNHPVPGVRDVEDWDGFVALVEELAVHGIEH